MHLVYPAVLAILLFCTGVYGVLARRNAILVLMSVELMLNAVNLNLVAFDAWLRDTLHAGQALTLFVIAIAAAEIGIGLAIVLMVYRTRGSIDVDRIRDTSEPAMDHAPDSADASDGTNGNGGNGGSGATPAHPDDPAGPAGPAGPAATNAEAPA